MCQENQPKYDFILLHFSPQVNLTLQAQIRNLITLPSQETHPYHYPNHFKPLQTTGKKTSSSNGNKNVEHKTISSSATRAQYKKGHSKN